MKRFMFLTIMLIALFSTVKQAEAGCDIGYTPDTLTMSINGCNVEVRICYKCSPLGFTESWIVVQSFVLEDSCNMLPPLDIEEIPQAIAMELLIGQSGFLSQLCGPGDFPPCGEDVYEVNITVPRCMYMMNISNRIWYFMCQNAERCITNYELCWDSELPGLITSEGTSTTGEGDTDCLELEMPDPPELNEQTLCFKVVTPCD